MPHSTALSDEARALLRQVPSSFVVRLQGLQAKPEYNGLEGIVLGGNPNGRVNLLIHIPGEGGAAASAKEMAVKPDNFVVVSEGDDGKNKMGELLELCYEYVDYTRTQTQFPADHPAQIELHFNMGMVMDRLGLAEAGVAMMTIAIDKYLACVSNGVDVMKIPDPNDGHTATFVGFLCEERGKKILASAKKLTAMGLEVAPLAEPCLADLLAALEEDPVRYNAAMELYAALGLFVGTPAAAGVHQQTGADSPVGVLVHFLDRMPAKPITASRVYGRCSQALLEGGQTAEALRFATAAVEVSERLQTDMNNPSRRGSIPLAALPEPINISYPLYCLAQVLVKQGDEGGAIEALERAMAADPSDLVSATLLSRLRGGAPVCASKDNVKVAVGHQPGQRLATAEVLEGTAKFQLSKGSISLEDGTAQ